MSARGQFDILPSSNPGLEFARRLEQMQKDIAALKEASARDGLPYPLRWRSTQLDNDPSFTIELYNPITGEACDICLGGGGDCDCEDGEDGADGLSLRSGSGPPSSLLGVPGDFYIDVTVPALYGPKVGTAWGSPTTLIGPPGADGTDGTNGADGADGNTGPQGGVGPPGGAMTWVQVFDAGVGAGDPGDTIVRFNNATMSSVTTITCDALDENSVNIQGIISELSAGGSGALLGHLRVVEVDNPVNWAFFTVSGRSTLSGYSTIAVTHEASTATAPFDDGDRVILTFTPMGLEGEQGDVGPTGPANGPPIYANTAARDAAIPSPVGGQMCVVGQNLQMYDNIGAGGWLQWDTIATAYTPTYNGITIGTGGNAFSDVTYQRLGTHVRLRLEVVLGSSGMAIAAPCTFTVPSGLNADVATGTFTSDRNDHGQANYVAAAAGYAGYSRIESATVVRLLVYGTAGAYAGNTGITNLIPATWVAGNVLRAEITYRLANPYV